MKIDEIVAGAVANVATSFVKKNKKKTEAVEITEEQFDEAAGEKDACYQS